MKSRLAPAVVLATIPLVLLGLSACSGSDGKTDTEKTASAQDWGLAHAKCMRDAGHDVQDPAADDRGQGVSLADGDTIEKFSADNDRCTAEVTKKLGERPVSDEQKKQRADDSKTDDCLRKEGVAVDGGKALSVDDIPKDVQEKCGIDAPTGGAGRAR